MLDVAAVVAQVDKGVDAGNSQYRPLKGWDASDPDGCWTHDWNRGYGAVPDYCHGFKVFETYGAALAYADTLKYSVTMLDTEVDRWTVTPLEAFYG